MRRVLGRCLSIVLLTGLLAGSDGAGAQPAAEPTPEQVKSLLQLLADPVVRSWIERETRDVATPEPGPEPVPAATAEAAELLEHFQWTEDGADMDEVQDELADVLTYAFMFADHMGWDVDEIIQAKLVKTRIKHPVPTGGDEEATSS